MSVFCQAAVYLLLALPAVAYPQSFATITIKPVRSSDARNARMQVRPNGDLIASAVPVIRLLSYAYDVPVNPSPRLARLPDWTLRETYAWSASSVRPSTDDNVPLPATQATSSPSPNLFLDRALSESFCFAT
jgi:hypothetical protein